MGVAKHGGGMGYRDLENFNLAILAKQLQRLITKPHSLVVSILKEKYFKHENALKAKIRGDSSFM